MTTTTPPFAPAPHSEKMISLANMSPLEDRIVGSMLASMTGDILGAAVEGWSISRIKKSQGGKMLTTFAHGNLRYGVYTDDTNSTLALASSLVENSNLIPKHAAYQYAKFWKEPPFEGLPIGYPGSAQAVMKDVLDGKDFKQTGRGSFPEGSFANGGIMRIAPVGLAFRNATDEELHTAVKWAIISSHVHPEAIDGAWLQAKSISVLLKMEASSMTPMEFIQAVRGWSRCEAMQAQLDKLISYIQRPKRIDDNRFVHIMGDAFQLRAIDALPSALWALYYNWYDPQAALIHAVNLGGDADTVGCIAGAMIGALHGHKWIPAVWWNINDTGRGRSYCVNLAKQLATLDLHEPVLTDEEKNFDFASLKKEEKKEDIKSEEATTETKEAEDTKAGVEPKKEEEAVKSD